MLPTLHFPPFMMHERESLELWYKVHDDSAPATSVEINNGNIGDLKYLINLKRRDIPVSDMILWKLKEPIPLIDRSNTELTNEINRIQLFDAESDEGLGDLEPLDAVSYLEGNPEPRHLHFIVQVSSVKRQRQFPYDTVVPREETVSSLYEKLRQHRWLHVRGTPGSGKTVLARLLQRYIKEIEPNTKVTYRTTWPEASWGFPGPDPGPVVILDEAETTYGDKTSWNRFKNPELQTDRLVAFASHDSSAYTGIDSNTPIWIPSTSCVGLSPLDCIDEISVGLLFTREEFNALLLLKFPDHHFSDSFLDCVFDITNGHVGACEELMKMVIAHPSYQNASEYTYDMFVSAVSMSDFLRSIANTTFARGLPSEDLLRESPAIASIFRDVIRDGSVARSRRYLVQKSKHDDEQQAALRVIIRSGWLHSEYIGSVCSTFPSPLHKRCVEWSLRSLSKNRPNYI